MTGALAIFRRERVTALAAELAILREYDETRTRLGHDFGCGQRGKELSRRRRELVALAGSDEWERIEFDRGSAELLAAWDRVGAARLARLVDETYRSATPASSRSIRAWRIVRNWAGVRDNHNGREL